MVALITLNEEDYEMEVSLRSALYALRLESEPRYLWIDRVCVDWSDTAEARRQELMRMHIYKNAKKVMLWIGEDKEKGDPLLFYLGRGSNTSTKAAFNLAVALAQSSKSEAQILIKETTLELIKQRWCYLANLFYRLWFRLSNIMRKNYADQLNEFEILCGTSSIPWSTLSCAADRMRALSPTTQIFQERRYRDTSKIIPDEERTRMLRWLERRVMFGFDPEETAHQFLRTCSTTKLVSMSP